MRKALKAGGQVMLLLNRRGFSTHVHCPGCGHVATCRHCDLSLTFHRTKAALVCHYCGYDTPPLLKCPQCGQSSVRYQGLGTEKLQAEIEEKFPDRVVQRMDSDTMSRPGSHQRVLDAFRDGLIHILLGTQMIAKGLDFPNVTLVGVVNADVGLHLPDFRAAERTFQLLAQVAGRAGRGDAGGLVMVQTFNPEHPCITLAAKHDFEEFAKLELSHRKQHDYPPYHRLARLIVRSEDEEAAATFADQLAGAFKQAVGAVGEPAGRCGAGAGSGSGRVPGVQAEQLLPVPLPVAVGEQRPAARGAARGAGGGEAAARRRVPGGRGPVQHAVNFTPKPTTYRIYRSHSLQPQ